MTRKVAITGAGAGIGQAACKVFADAGWSVIGLDKNELDDAKLDSFIKVDLADPSATEDALDSLVASGPLAALVNNAAVLINHTLENTDLDDWNLMLGVNLRAVFQSIRRARTLVSGGGSIINVSSVHALASSEEKAGYAASKAAVVALTRVAALELGPANIRVNAVLPGAVDTQMLHKLPEDRKKTGGALAVSVQRTPLRRIAEPNEIAEAILFLADSTRSGFITGESIAVDGGALARLSTE